MPNCGEYRCLMLPISNDITYVKPESGSFRYGKSRETSSYARSYV